MESIEKQDKWEAEGHGRKTTESERTARLTESFIYLMYAFFIFPL